MSIEVYRCKQKRWRYALIYTTLMEVGFIVIV